MKNRGLFYKFFVNFLAFYMTLIMDFHQNWLNFLRVYKRNKAKLPELLNGKVVIVTGANSGIGKVTAKTFAHLGAKVFILCRDAEKAKVALDDIKKELDPKFHSNIIFEQMNLSSLSSVRNCAERINLQVTKIDYLINNAGIMCCPESRSKDGYEMQFATNHLGHFLLTNLLLEKIRASPSGRIIILSSVVYINGVIYFNNINLEGIYNPLKAYSQSKLANFLFGQELARKLRNESKIKVLIVHPGVIDTELVRHFSGFFKMCVTITRKLVFISPKLGAQTTLYCALDEKCQQDESGGYYANCRRIKKPWPHATDENDAKRLWELSVRMCVMENNNIHRTKDAHSSSIIVEENQVQKN